MQLRGGRDDCLSGTYAEVAQHGATLREPNPQICQYYPGFGAGLHGDSESVFDDANAELKGNWGSVCIGVDVSS